MEKQIIEIAGKRLITFNTFANDLGVHVRTIQLWAKRTDMPIIRIGNQRLIDLDDIPAWLEGRKSRPM